MDAQDKIGSFWAFSLEEAVSIVQTDLKKGYLIKKHRSALKDMGAIASREKSAFRPFGCFLSSSTARLSLSFFSAQLFL